MRTLKISRDAEKAWSGLQAKQYKQIGNTILALLKDPAPPDSLLLKGATRGERRVDIGEFRVIYTFDDDVVSVLVIGKRNDNEVYKLWNRKKGAG